MKMKIDLDSMSEQELRELNREIIKRLQLQSFVRNKSQLMSFRIGDRVAFETDHGTIEGMVTRINQKTATVEGDDGRGFRVSPCLLSKIVGPAPAMRAQATLFSVNSKNSEQR